MSGVTVSGLQSLTATGIASKSEVFLSYDLIWIDNF